MTEDLKIKKINENDVLVSYDLAQFRNLLDMMNACNYVHRLSFSPSGLSIHTLDPAYILLQILEIPAESFQKYNINSTFEVGLKIPQILEILKTSFLQEINLGNSLEITTIESKEDPRSNGGLSTFINFKTGPLTFSVKAISLNSIKPVPREPKLSYKFEFSIPTEKLHNALTLVSTFSAYTDHIKFEGTRLFAGRDPNWAPDEGNLDDVCYSLQGTELMQTETGNPIPTSRFTHGFLFDIIDPLRNIASESLISLRTDYPMKISAIGSGGERITLILAPRSDTV